MSDIIALVGRLRHFNAWRRDHDGEIEQPSPRQIGLDIDEACDALETLAGENAELRKENEALDREWASAIDILGPFETAAGDNLAKVAHAVVCRMVAAESRLARLAPVVEAERHLVSAEGPVERGGWMDELRRALATLEAAHD